MNKHTSFPKFCALPALCLAAALLCLDETPASAPASRNGQPTVLGIDGTQFTLNGKPAFLLGISYYGALGASEDFIRRDLDDLQDHGFNWLRVGATWAAFDHDVSAVDADGHRREPFLGKLQWLVAECDHRGQVVGVSVHGHTSLEHVERDAFGFHVAVVDTHQGSQLSTGGMPHDEDPLRCIQGQVTRLRERIHPMPKFYVESGPARCVIDATDVEDAAIRAFQWSCDSRDSVLAPEWLDEAAAAEFDGWELGEEIRVSEQGFSRSDAQVFDTLDLVPVWQGYAFPWC